MTPVRPERWQLDAGDADVAVLQVPPVLRRDRLFEVDVQLSVQTPPAAGAWLEVTLEVDGAREWSRRIDARCPGQTDTLDFHCRRLVPEGRALRLRALARVGGGARRQRLLLSAEETGDA